MIHVLVLYHSNLQAAAKQPVPLPRVFLGKMRFAGKISVLRQVRI